MPKTKSASSAKTLVTTKNLSSEDKQKFKALLDTMAARFGGKSDSYLLLLAYKDYPNLFSLKTSKEMVDNPDRILLEVELYKAWQKNSLAFRRQHPFSDWRDANVIYQDFLRREEDSNMHAFVEHISEGQQEFPSSEEPPSIEHKEDSAPVTFSLTSKLPSQDADIATRIKSLRDALELEADTIKKSKAFHQSRIDHHAEKLSTLEEREQQSQKLKETLDASYHILTEADDE